MHQERRRYLSYLLRIWEAPANGEKTWHASLEHPGTRERQGFASLESLFAFLLNEVGEAPGKKEVEDG